MTLGEYALLELAVEFLLFCTKWAAWSLLDGQVSDKLHLLLAPDLLIFLESGATLFCKCFVINLAARLGWEHDCIRLHVLVIPVGSLNPVIGKELLSPVGCSLLQKPSERYAALAVTF